jgi:hypothetical protein
MIAANPTRPPALTSKSVPIPFPDLCALCVSAFSSLNVDALDAASSISPLFATLTENTGGWGYPGRASNLFVFSPFNFELPALFTLLAVSPERKPRRERSRRVDLSSPISFRIRTYKKTGEGAPGDEAPCVAGSL